SVVGHQLRRERHFAGHAQGTGVDQVARTRGRVEALHRELRVDLSLCEDGRRPEQLQRRDDASQQDEPTPARRGGGCSELPRAREKATGTRAKTQKGQAEESRQSATSNGGSATAT